MSTAPDAVEHAAVTVIGELVQAQVGHQHGVITELAVQSLQRDVQHAVRVVGAGPDRVLVLGHAEDHQPADTGRDGVDRGLDQALLAVLHDAGHGRDRYRLADPLADEHRQHEVLRSYVDVGDQPAQGGRAP